MSSTTWTPRAVASNAAPLRHALWRAVEAQHVVATMALVDTLDEQHVLERLLDDEQAAGPRGAAYLHYLLFTPFRYPPPPGGSRFRGPTDPGVFYGADEIRTACAELGYWRWRHLLDTPALTAMPAGRRRCSVKLATDAVDLRGAVRARSAALDRSRATTARCQRSPAAREANVGAIRYESVRDPRHAAAARCSRPGARLRVPRRSSSRRGCCRSRASASCGSAPMRCAAEEHSNSPRQSGHA